MKKLKLSIYLLFVSACIAVGAQVIDTTYVRINQQVDSLPRPNIILPVDSQPDEITLKYAKLLGVSDTLIKNPQLYKEIDQWMGTPYRYGGSSQKGTDCSGFVSQILKKFTTFPVPRSASEMSKVVTEKSIDELQEGDLVFFHLGNVHNRHVGIYLQNGWFVHASSYKGVGVTLNNIFKDQNYKRRFSKCGSIELDKIQAE